MGDTIHGYEPTVALTRGGFVLVVVKFDFCLPYSGMCEVGSKISGREASINVLNFPTARSSDTKTERERVRRPLLAQVEGSGRGGERVVKEL